MTTDAPIEPTEWLSVAAAAARLGVHPRTVERRAASGKLTARRAADGSVQIEMPAEPSKPTAEAVADVLAVQADRQIQLAGAIVGASERELATMRTELAEVRRSSRWAWRSVAAVVALGSLGAVCSAWTWAGSSERLRGDLRAAEARAEAVQTVADASTAEAARLRDDLAAARRLTDSLIEAMRQDRAVARQLPGVPPTGAEPLAAAKPETWPMPLPWARAAFADAN